MTLNVSRNKKWDRRFLDLAAFVGQWSKDPSTKVGAVIVDRDHRVVSVGYNGFARGVQDTPERYDNREIKYRMILHGDLNALLFSRGSVAGCTLYVSPLLTCAQCAAAAIQMGIKRVVAPDSRNPRWHDDNRLALEMYAEAGVKVTIL